MKNLTFMLLTLLLLSSVKIAQTVTGKVTDESGKPLIGANVIVRGTTIGTAADEEGTFELKDLSSKTYRLEISMVGYTKFISEEFDLAAGDTKNFNVELKEKAFQSDQVIVTAGKYEQNISELPVSAEIITADEFSSKNYLKLDDALRYAPGVNVTLDQVSIRGSSGYSRGAGTRVLVAIDGFPIYTGDTGEIIWEIVPVTDLERVEIIKGAASSLYGSTAIGGVINVITKNIPSSPLTFVKSYFGIYGNPSHDEWKWTDSKRTFNGQTVSHSNRINKFGYSISFSRTEDLSYRANDWRKRYAGFIKSNYFFSENTSLDFLMTGYFQNRGTFNFWKDANNALLPPDDDIGQTVPSNRLVSGLKLNHRLNKIFSVSLRTSLYRTHWEDRSESANTSTTYLSRNEIQTSYDYSDKLKNISGIELSYGTVESNIFSNPISTTVGVYSQFDYHFDFPLFLTVGARYDYSRIDTLNSFGSFSPKIGLNYKLTENTILRSSFAKGFRAPTLAETFTETVTSGIRVKPNPELISEENYSFELGVNKNFGNFMNLDLAIFQNEYFDFIEPGIDPADGQIFFDNTTRARIQGFEIIDKLNLNFLNSELSFGYTYLWARDTKNNTPLKYRPRHLLYTSVQTQYDFMEFGVNFRYWSRVEAIDDELVSLGFVPGGDKRVEVFLLDFTLGANLFTFGLPAKIYGNLNNALNYNYVEMIGNLSPIRNISLSLEMLF